MIKLDDTQEVRNTSEPAEKRGAWYLLTGMILGLILGLVFAWVINPVIYENTTPANLDEGNKDTYRSMIAQVYAATGDFNRAVLRLAVLEDVVPLYALGAQAQRALADGRQQEAWCLALFASALQTSLENVNYTNHPDVVPTQTLPVLNATP